MSNSSPFAFKFRTIFTQHIEYQFMTISFDYQFVTISFDYQFVPCYRAGTGKSGTFVAISQLMEKLDVSNTINVFKTVKRLLQDRMAVIQTLVRKFLKEIYHPLLSRRHWPMNHRVLGSIPSQSTAIRNGSYFLL